MAKSSFGTNVVIFFNILLYILLATPYSLLVGFYETNAVLVLQNASCWVLNGRWIILESVTDYLLLISGLRYLFVSVLERS